MVIITCFGETDTMPVEFALCYYKEQMTKFEYGSAEMEKAMYVFMKLVEGETLIDADRME